MLLGKVIKLVCPGYVAARENIQLWQPSNYIEKKLCLYPLTLCSAKHRLLFYVVSPGLYTRVLELTHSCGCMEAGRNTCLTCSTQGTTGLRTSQRVCSVWPEGLKKKKCRDCGLEYATYSVFYQERCSQYYIVTCLNKVTFEHWKITS